MGWEKRGNKTFFYRSVRINGRVRKIYHGSGRVATITADLIARQRAERAAEHTQRRAEWDQLEQAIGQTRILNHTCDLLASTALLLAGYHRPARHGWRIWRDARRTQHTAH